MARFFYHVIFKVMDTKGVDFFKSCVLTLTTGLKSRRFFNAFNRITISSARSYLPESDAFFSL
jgi:hypothetical protein